MNRDERRWGKQTGAALLLLALALGAGAGEGRVDSAPYAACSAHVTLPPFLENRLLYFHSFAKPEPDVNALGFESPKKPAVAAEGFSGGCAVLKGELVLQPSKQPGAKPLSLDRPLTIGFWWCAPDGLPANAGGGFFSVNCQHGYLSNFIRGGPWCELRDSANVFQVYSFPGMGNYNGIFDYTFRQGVALGKDQWHCTVLTVSNASEMRLYVDGKLAAEFAARGRSFTASDAVQRLAFGSFPGAGLYVDELMILDVALSAEQVAFCYEAVRSLRQVGLVRAGK